MATGVAFLLSLAACGGSGATDGEASEGGASEGGASDAGAAAGADSYDWQYANYLPPNSSLSTGIANYFDVLEEEETATIEEFYQEALLSATDILPGTAQGRADLGFMIALYYPGELPLSQVVGVPFVTSDAEAQVRAFNDLYTDNEAFRSEYEEQGVHVLSFVPIAGTIVGTTEPLEDLEGLQGRSIRVVGLLTEAMASVGVNPVALTAPEVYESLERGVIEGFTSYPFDVAIASSLHEPAPYMTDVGTGIYNLGALIITKSLWDSLPAEDQEAMESHIGDYVDEAVRLVTEEDDARCATFLEAGGVPFVFPEAEVAEFEEAVGDSVLETWREQTLSAGVTEADLDAFYEEYRTSLAEYEESSSYSPGLERCVEQAGS